MREEVKLYTIINFFAEVGGYLGLLLGESLLSYLITATKWFQTLKRKFKEHCRKAEEEPESTRAWKAIKKQVPKQWIGWIIMDI